MQVKYRPKDLFLYNTICPHASYHTYVFGVYIICNKALAIATVTINSQQNVVSDIGFRA